MQPLAGAQDVVRGDGRHLLTGAGHAGQDADDDDQVVLRDVGLLRGQPQREQLAGQAGDPAAVQQRREHVQRGGAGGRVQQEVVQLAQVRHDQLHSKTWACQW